MIPVYKEREDGKCGKRGNEMKRMKRDAIWIFLGCLFLMGIPLMISGVLYEQQYGGRNETPTNLKYDLSLFPHLERTPVSFKSNEGQLLAGYVYTHRMDETPRGVIIVSSGIETGHNAYLPEINYMIENGFTVFAYDGTGNDESEGKSTGGYLQAVVDLDYAIHLIKDDEQFEGLPIMLYGHGSGGYAVVSVLNNHRDITAVVERSGFSTSIDELTNRVGILKPYFKMYEYLKYGKYAEADNLNVLMETNSYVLLLHSEDDPVIQYGQSFFKYESLLTANPRLIFKRYQNRGHEIVLNEQLVQTLQAQIEEYSSLVHPPQSVKRMYQQVVYEAKKQLDPVIMQQIIDFYNKYMHTEYE